MPDRLRRHGAGAEPAAGLEPPHPGSKDLQRLDLEYMETIPEPGTSLKLHGHVLEIMLTADNAVKTVRYRARRQVL